LFQFSTIFRKTTILWSVIAQRRVLAIPNTFFPVTKNKKIVFLPILVVRSFWFNSLVALLIV
jgi:hypothetical protein